MTTEPTSRLARDPADVQTIDELARLLRRLRRREARRRGATELTYRELAARTGWSHGIIGEYLNGNVLPPTERFDRLTQLLGASPPERGALATARDRVEENRRPPAVPAPTGATPRPRQLPAAIAGFVGREKQLAELDRLLVTVDGRRAAVISAVSGMAGVGKTALAVHWGHRVAHRFPDGQLYVNLRGFAAGQPVAPVEALARLLRSLGVPADEVPAEEPAAAGRYRSVLAGRRVLVVLDNAATAEQVRPLLPGSPGCLTVVTSRNRLTGLVAREGARSLPLDALHPDEAGSLLTELIGAELVAAEPAAVAELAEVCSYLPLALRVAAANVATHPEHSITTQVAALHGADGLSTLEVPGDEPAGVRRAFELSYLALRPPARRLFRLIGLVPGPDLSVEAAAALADLPIAEVRSLLAELVTVHLLNQPAPGRYACHDLLRRYAAERAHADETPTGRQTALQRLDQWFLHWTDAAATVLYPHRLRAPVPAGPAPAATVLVDDVSALAWLDAERTNLVAVVRHAADHGRRRTASLLADSLRGYFWLRMHAVEWGQTAQAALAAADADDDPGAQAPARLSLGDLHYRLGQYPAAIEHHTHALAACRRTGWTEGQIAALGNLGVAHRDLGRLTRAVDYLSEALALCRTTGASYAEAVTLDCLGRSYWQLGDLAKAAECFTDALALNRRLGARQAVAACLGDLAEICQTQGQLDDALTHTTTALELVRSLGDRGNEATLLRVLALIHRDTGHIGPALAAAHRAIQIARELAERRTEADSLTCLGSILHRHGQPDPAIAAYTEALALAHTIGDRYLEVEALLGLAAVNQDLDRPDLARKDTESALSIANQLGYQLLATRAQAARS